MALSLEQSEERRRQRLATWAENANIPLDKFKKQLDFEMKTNGGPTFDDNLERVCYVIDDSKPAVPKYHRAQNLLGVNTDFLRRDEAIEEIDSALKQKDIRPEVLAVMEVSVKVKPKYHSKKQKGEGKDPLFGIYHNMQSD